MANLSKTLHINFYQNQSSIIEVMIKKFWCVFLCLTVYSTWAGRQTLYVGVRMAWYSQLNDRGVTSTSTDATVILGSICFVTE